MIRRGKQDGWLHAPKSTLLPWATLNGCRFEGVNVEELAGKGLAVVAKTDLKDDIGPLMTVPREMILSLETVELHAKADKHLRDGLDALGSFGKTARGAILTFLLMQATHLCPEVDDKIGLTNPLEEYLKYLPLELLPTFWNQEELSLLDGTSLSPATDAKLNSLHREYELLRSTTIDIDWCRKYWWDEVDGMLSFDDWKQVDAAYRSRALEFPGIGDAMVPCVDMCNHASGDHTTALYECDDSGNGLLLLRDGKTLTKGEEIDITYGDQKGACEMIFSYGFLEDVGSARDVFLDLQMPEDDPLRVPKKAIATSAPGVRLFESNEGLRWESDYLWLICVNEEDGLRIDIAPTGEDKQELILGWREQQLFDDSRLKDVLGNEELWDVYHLRAISILQERVEQQLRYLYGSDKEVMQRSQEESIRETPSSLALRLRQLESELLEKFYEHFENEVRLHHIVRH